MHNFPICWKCLFYCHDCICVVGMYYFAAKKGKSFYRIDGDLGKALISLYGTILIVSLFQENAVKNIVDSAYGSLTLFFITMPLWMVLYVGHQYDIRKWIIYVTYGNMYAFHCMAFLSISHRMNLD